MPIAKVCIVIIIMSLITLAARALPFVSFKKHKPPRMLDVVEKYIPPAIMVILVFFCIKDVPLLKYPYGVPEFAGIAAVIVLHLWQKNAMLSIAAGTACYMILIRAM